MKVCFGGTFNILHKGHELLFEKAFENDNQVFIGITSVGLARKAKEVDIEEFEKINHRRPNVEEMVKDMGGAQDTTRRSLSMRVRRDDFASIGTRPLTCSALHLRSIFPRKVYT